MAKQNSDGGWGDTIISFSNLSTTVLCWSALSFGPEIDEDIRTAVERAERWIRAQVGDLSAERLKTAIVKRYGKDHTFSVPILTVLALTGKLGSGASAWRLVPQLPFELAACPNQWFQWLRLPVVSYALPAMVAIGQARHHHAPARNPLLASIRSALRLRTLQKARDMQPESGGYLEAIPLTAFVVMSLIDSGAAKDPVVTHGIRFLASSARADGSWPIDTNLATWVTSLSVDALALGDELPVDDRQRILRWLLDQQLAHEHPFTHASPGGWAWTDLSGGVPDADDTAAALLAIWTLAGPKPIDAAVAGVNWLLELQNSDGGIPTFCRGWGALPFDRSAPDLTAHALQAWSTWYPAVPPLLQHRITRAAERALSYLARHQQAAGSWAPLWFGNQHAASEVNLTYGTGSVISALSVPLVRELSIAERSRRLGLTWLLNAQNSDGGWGGAAGIQASIEETGIALYALAESTPSDAPDDRANATLRGIRWLINATHEGHCTPASPIGLYFARLWYYEELYPIVFALRGLSRARVKLLQYSRTDAG
jgi:squalene-hopene/tetraprenyl-beta-curcumene cyclase